MAHRYHGRPAGVMLAFACACAVAGGVRPAAQSDVSAVVERAMAWVDEFQRRFGSMVSEERYDQSAREAIPINSRNVRSADERVTLVSDFLLVQVPGEGWTPFRDVFERNGRKLRDREERLAKLFLNGASRSAFDQAREIMLEGARYNVGTIERTINLPTLPLLFLTSAHRDGFHFELARRDGDDDTGLEFKELRRPTYITTTGGRDLPVSGRFWVDEVTGTVHRTELDAVDSNVEAHIKVTYRLDESLQLWVPARMEERYRDRRSGAEARGVATYSRFRKFQVSTSEEIAQ